MVKIENIVDMQNELNDYKKKLLKAIETGTLPQVNSDMILQKHIKITVADLKRVMPLVSAKRLAKNVLTQNMKDILSEQ